MEIIKAADFIDSGFSEDDALLLIPYIDAAKDANIEFVVDFSGVHYFTTLFFSTALTRLVGELREEEYRRRVHVRNLSESGAETYKHALDYAIEFFKKTAEERESTHMNIRKVMEDI